MTSLRLVPFFVVVVCACATQPNADDDAAAPPIDGGQDSAFTDGAFTDGDGPDTDLPDADNSDGGPNTQPCDGVERLCGKLVFGSAVAGLRFSTPTEAGETDASGGFVYRASETVVFSIGGTTLGSAEGAAVLTLFDLVGAAPPSTEALLRAELHDPLDVTAFDRVVNLATLLVSLDPGLDASDGIDVSNWDETLAGETIALDAPLYHFQARSLGRVARRFGVHRTAHLPTVFTLLYASIGVVIPAHVVVREQVDSGDDGTVEHDRRFQHDDAGRTIATIDARADGVPFAAERITYDAFGRVGARRSEVATTATLGELRTRTLVESAYDSVGRLVTTTTTVDTDLDGIDDETQVRAFVYDARGNPTLETVQSDDVENETTTMTYDALGNLVLLRYVDDRTSEQRTSTRTYADDRLLGDVLAIDRGASASRITHTYTYVAGRLVLEVTETDLEDDGVSDRRDEDAYTYDEDGTMTSLIERRSVTANETIRTWTFDAEGRITSQVLDHGAALRLRDVHTTTFLENGDRVAWQMEWLRDGIRRRMATGSITYVYAEDGYELHRVQTVTNDGNAATTRITRDYVAIPDGLVALVSAYAAPATP